MKSQKMAALWAVLSKKAKANDKWIFQSPAQHMKLFHSVIGPVQSRPSCKFEGPKKCFGKLKFNCVLLLLLDAIDAIDRRDHSSL